MQHQPRSEEREEEKLSATELPPLLMPLSASLPLPLPPLLLLWVGGALPALPAPPPWRLCSVVSAACMLCMSLCAMSPSAFMVSMLLAASSSTR